MKRTVLLLLASNIFMTFAWYGHLKFKWLEHRPLLIVILVSWGLAFFEYCFQVPGNRIGFASGLSGYQLKILQEMITLGVFVVFAAWFLGERLTWNYLASFACMGLAAWFAFGFRRA